MSRRWNPFSREAEDLVNDIRAGRVAYSGAHVTHTPREGRPSSHPGAPQGISRCVVCGRWVMRGLGEWWRDAEPRGVEL